MASRNNAVLLDRGAFECFNINCYARFKSERGLRQHLWRSAPCQEYMSSEARPIAECNEIVHPNTWCRRLGYGVESTRLNPLMSTEPPLYTPYQEFDYSTNFDGGDGSIDDGMFDLNNVSTGIDVALSSPVLNATMERIKARERHAVMLLQHDVEHRSIVNLLKLLEDSQCPDYMLQKILQWAYNAKLDGFDFNPRATTRKANIQWMYNALENSHQLLPQVIPVTLEDHDGPQDVVCFDFASALLSLLQNESLMATNNLVLNKDDPISMFIPSDNKIGEANSGSRYRELYQELAQGKDQLLVPIIMYLDGTAIDSKGHIEVCPVSFTTSLFTEKARRDVDAWRLLGYVPDLNRGRSGAMNTFANTSSQSKGRTTRNFHKIMDVMMQGLANGQAGSDRRLKKVPLKLCDRWFIVDIVCPLLFVINDGKQGDQLCCRTNGHHRSTRRHHRSCDCLYEDLNNPDVQCTFLSSETINHACENGSDVELQELSIYKCDNAFNRIHMGQNPHGIFMCAVVDVMHTIQHGIIMYALESFKKGIGAETLAKLDRMALKFDKTCCQSIRSSFPRTDFSRGVTNLSMVECTEQSGTLFLLTCLTMQVEGWHALDGYFPNSLEAVLGTMECLLCFEAWLDRYTFWEIGDPDGEAAEADAAICSLMKLITTYLPRQAGNGWNLSKFHEIKHMVRFIEAFGAPRGYNASRPEEHHKAHAKRPGRRSQKNLHTIDHQCGRRIADAIVIDTMQTLFRQTQESHSVTSNVIDLSEGNRLGQLADPRDPSIKEVCSGTPYQIRSFRDPDNGNQNQLCREVIFSTQIKGPIKLEDNLALFILQSYRKSDLDQNGEGFIKCYTEYHKFDAQTQEKMVSVRCHPNFMGRGFAWYDWAIMRFVDDDENEDEFPCRVLCCIPRHNSAGVQTTVDLVIQCCGEPTGRGSFLFTEWTFKKDFFTVSADAIVRLCFVVASSEVDTDVLVVTDKLEWASLFYNAAMVDYAPPQARQQ